MSTLYARVARERRSGETAGAVAPVSPIPDHRSPIPHPCFLPAFIRRRRPLRAFSLLELAVVLAIMGMLLMVAQPRLSGFVLRDRVRRSAQRLQVDLRFAQAEAIRTRRKTAVSFDPLRDFYTVWFWDKSGVPVWKVIDDGRVVALGADPDYHVGITSTTFTNDAVAFDAVGIPSEGGTVLLGSGTLRITVTVDAASGRATVGDLTENAPSPGLSDDRPLEADIDRIKPLDALAAGLGG